MGEVSTIGLDREGGFQAHGADTAGGVVCLKKLSRKQLLAFFVSHPRKEFRSAATQATSSLVPFPIVAECRR